jgi:alpha-N-arabinofuranosidase
MKVRMFQLAIFHASMCLVPTLICGAQVTEDHPPPATVIMSVDAGRTDTSTIPRTLFGTFLEPIGNSTYNGLWAEILQNPSLEGGLWDAPHVQEMLKDEPELNRASALGIPLPWEPLDAAEGNRYEMHWGDAANSWRSVEIIGVPGKPTGILQKVYLPVHRELKYNGSLFVKHVSGPTQLVIQLRPHDAATVLAEQTIEATAKDWTEYKFSFALPAGSLARLDPADFVVEVSGDERADVDNIQLFPADAIDGLDPDEVKMAKAMDTPLLRFGGNFTSGYHWTDGIGPEQKRISMRNVAWGIPEYNTFGTDQLLEFCRLIGAKPQIALNLGSGTPEEAAGWVKYVDARFDGSRGGLLWELGNELWGTWNLGWPTLGQLPGRTLDFSRAVRAVDPNAKLIATGGDMDWFHHWNAAQLTDPAGTFNYLSTHFVVTTDETVLPHPSTDFMAQATFALPVELGRKLKEAQTQIDTTPAFAHHTHLAFTEWLYVAHRPDAPQFSNMGGAIGAADFFNMLLRNADIVPISDMTGIMEFAGIWKKRSQVYASPAYYAFKLYAGAQIAHLVDVDNDGGSYSVHKGVTRLPEIADVPYLDSVAAVNASGDLLTLFVVNRHLTRDLATEIRLKDFNARSIANVQTLSAPSLEDGNSEEQPENVIPTTATANVEADRIHYVFPHESITVITMNRR